MQVGGVIANNERARALAEFTKLEFTQVVDGSDAAATTGELVLSS